MKQKRSKKFIVGIVLLIVGGLSLFGSFGMEGSKVAAIIGSVIIAAVGVLLLYLEHKNNGASVSTPTQTQASAQPTAAPVPESESKHNLFDTKKVNNTTVVSAEPSTTAPRQQPTNTSARNEQQSLYMAKRRAAFTALLSSVPRHNICLSSAPSTSIPVKQYYLDYNKLRVDTNISRLLDFVVLDLETTGLNAGSDRIIQISAIRFLSFEPVEMFSTYINPDKHISEEATKINGITDDMVINAPRISEILPDFEKWVGESTIIGHNLMFDIKFMRKAGYDNERKKRYYFDTCELSRNYDKDLYDHKLVTVCNNYGIYYDNAHDSSADALACGLLFLEYVRDKKDISSAEYPHIFCYYNAVSALE